MKKVLCLLVVLTMALGCIGISASAADYGTVLNNNVAMLVGSTRAVANNTLVTLSDAPAEADGEALVSAGVISQLLNGSVYSDEANGYVDIGFTMGKDVSLRAGSKTYTLNGRTFGFDVAPQEVGGVLMIPLKEIVEDVLDEYYFYDPTTKLVVISSRKVLKDYATDGAVITMIASAISSGSLPPISVPDRYEIDWSQFEEPEDIGGPSVSNDQGQLQFVSLTASAEPEPQNSANSLIDGNVGTFWAIGDAGGFAVADLGKVNNMTEIKVAFSKYTERAAQYEVWVSEDNKNYERVFAGQSTQGQQWMSHQVSGAYRYVKIVSNGNSAGSTWNSIAELQAFNGGSDAMSSAPTVVITADPIPRSRYSYMASAEPEPENGASSAFDGDNNTYWAAQGSQSLVLTLGESEYVSSISLHIRPYDDGRSLNYGIEYSTDGSAYTSVFSGQSQPGGGSDEAYAIESEVKNIRISVNGSTTGDWTSICEVNLYGEAKETTVGGDTGSGGAGGGVTVGDEIPSTAFTYTATAEPQPENPARSAFDGNADTYWAVENSHSITIDLGSVQPVGAVGVQMRRYAENPGRTVNYTVEYSTDGTSFTGAYSGAAAAGGGVMEQREIGLEARYIRVGVNGSNEGSWASVSEIKVYGVGAPAAGTGASGYVNMDTVDGQFMLVAVGTSDKLSVSGDGTSLTVGSAEQKWVLESGAVKNVETGKCMDVFNESYEEGGQIGVWDYNDGLNQQWTFEKDGDGYYVKNAMSALYLSVVGGAVQQRSKANATKWIVTDGSVSAGGSTDAVVDVGSIEGDYIITLEGSNESLAVDENNEIIATPYTGDPSQVWHSDTSLIVNSGDSLCMDVYQSSPRVGFLICASPRGSSSTQRWSFIAEGGAYYIKNNTNGLYVSVGEDVVHQRTRIDASKFVITPVENAVVYTPPVTSYVNTGSVENGFMLAVDGTTDVLSVNDDNFSLSVGPDNGRADWVYEDGSLKNRASGLCMDVSDQSMDDGHAIIVWEGNDGTNQQWEIEIGNNCYYIKSVMSGLYLSVVNGEVQQRSKNRATKWIITDGTMETNVFIEGDVPEVNNSSFTNLDAVPGEFLLVRFNSDDVLTVGSDNLTLSVAPYEQDAKQQWTIDGLSFKNVGCGLCIDVSGQSKEDGGTICVWEGNGGDNQVWAFEKDGGGYYVKSILSGLYLSVVDGAIQQKTKANATKWMIADK